ncbi:MAG TPA: hypothetical protein PLW86_18670, partial [Rhodocyclaceae bacterium]|nr:hypothetical protein [Rhodocyclaceae bacterium]
MHIHPALLGELDCVANQIRQYLFQAQAITDKKRRHVGGGINRKPDVPIARQLPGALNDEQSARE